MNTPTNIKAKKTKNEYTVYPGNEFYDAIMRMLNENTPIKIVMVSEVSGDIVFSCTLSDLGLTPQSLSNPICRTNIFADMLGELLVRQSIEQFSARVIDKYYNATVREYNHKHFGMKITDNDTLMFQCHSSLIYKLVNESLGQLLTEEAAKTSAAIVGPKKVKRGGNDDNRSVISYCDDTSMRLIIPKKKEIHHGFETAIEMILNFYKITGKDVFIANNLFSFEIEIKDK